MSGETSAAWHSDESRLRDELRRSYQIRESRVKHAPRIEDADVFVGHCGLEATSPAGIGAQAVV